MMLSSCNYELKMKGGREGPNVGVADTNP
jgi:hypothetical protein